MALGITQAQLADAIGVGQTTVAKWEREQSNPKRSTVRDLARVLKCNIRWLEYDEQGDAPGEPDQAPIDLVFVKGEVRASYWAEAEELEQVDQEHLDIPRDPRYPKANRFALKVKGRSMDLLYPDGTHLICVNVVDADEAPTPGKKVICRRTRRDGLIEQTVKELGQDDNGKSWLIPRSTDPRHQAPIPLDGNGDPMIESVEIVALVIGSYRQE